MKFSPLKFATAALLLISACTYEPDETFFNEVVVTEPVTSISLNEYDNVDTIYIFNDVTFNYLVSFDGPGAFLNAGAYLNGAQVSSSNDRDGKFTIKHDSYQFKTGTYTLTIEFRMSSGSGSLADKLNAEQFRTWRSWVLVLDFDKPPSPAAVTSTDQGFLKLSWNKYTKPNFQNYSITRWQSGAVKTYKITDPQKNFWIDSAYVGTGAQVDYTINTVALGSSSQTIRYSASNSLTGTFNSLDSMVTLKWRKTKFFEAVKEFVIASGPILFRTSSVTDTTATFKVNSFVFGTALTLSLAIVPKYGPSTISYSYSTSFQPGTKMKHVSVGTQMFYNKPTQQFIGYSTLSNYFYLYNASLQATDSILTPDVSISVPYLGNDIYWTYFSEYGYTNLITKEKKVKRDTRNRTNFRGTLNHLVSFNYSTSSVNTGKVVDMISDNEVFTQNSARTSSNSTSVSPDGKFFINTVGTTVKVYKVTGTTSAEVGQLPEQGLLGFRDDVPNEIMVRSGFVVDIYDANDVSLIRTIALPFVTNTYFFNSYDAATHTICWRNDADVNRHVVVDVETGKSKVFRSNGTFSLVNGRLFNSNGYHIKLL